MRVCFQTAARCGGRPLGRRQMGVRSWNVVPPAIRLTTSTAVGSSPDPSQTEQVSLNSSGSPCWGDPLSASQKRTHSSQGAPALPRVHIPVPPQWPHFSPSTFATSVSPSETKRGENGDYAFIFAVYILSLIHISEPTRPY